MIARPGIFITAKHCLYRDKQQTEQWADLMVCLNNLVRPIWLEEIENSDLAIGQLDLGASPELSSYTIWPLCTWELVDREMVCHFGCQDSTIEVQQFEHPDYHLSFTGAYSSFPGHFLQSEPQYPPFSQKPVFITSATVPNAASGGPVAQGNGYVFGITTTSSEGGGYSVCSLIADLFDAQIPDDIAEMLGIDPSCGNFGEALALLGAEISRGA